MSAPTAALFLDRDGVINVERGYVHRIDQFEFMPGIFDLARFAARDLGWLLIVVTNQSGIGRGYFDEAQYQALTEWMGGRFRAEGAPIARAYHCPFHPEASVAAYRRDHDWRKPKPGMILQAARDFGLDLARSALIGDKADDITAAVAAGIRWPIRLDKAGAAPADPAHRMVRTLAEALAFLRAQCATPAVAANNARVNR